MRRVVVANPMSAGGSTGGRGQRLEQLAKEILACDVRWTDAPGAGRRLAREAVEEGFDEVAAVGGDGTISEVVDGMVAAGGGTLGIVPSGTGGDLARALGLSRDPETAMRELVDAPTHPVDVIEMEAVGADGRPFVRHGINLSGLGMAGDVVRRVNEGTKRLGGRLTFAIATLRSLLAWTSPEATVRWVEADGAPGQWQGRFVNLFVGNARHCGGGMLVTPDARMDDGLLDVVLIPEQPLFDLVRRTPALYDGTVGQAPGVVSVRVREISVEPGKGAHIPLDLDGEAVGVAPATLRPKAGQMRLRVAPRSGDKPVFGVDHLPGSR